METSKKFFTRRFGLIFLFIFLISLGPITSSAKANLNLHADPFTPTKLGEFSNQIDNVRHLKVVGDILYLLDDTYDVIMLDISNPAAPKYVNYISTVQTPRDLDIYGDLLYLATDGEIYIYNVSDPYFPQSVIQFTVNNAYSIFYSDKLIYIGINSGTSGGPTYGGSLLIKNVTDPLNIGDLGSIETGDVENLVVYNSTCYICSYTDGLIQTVNVSNPNLPKILNNYTEYDTTEGGPQNIFISGDIAYVSNYDAGLAIVNNSDPASLNILKVITYPLGREPYSHYVYDSYFENNILCVGTGSGFYIYNASDKVNIREIGRYDSGDIYQAIVIENGIIYCSSSKSLIEIFSLDPDFSLIIIIILSVLTGITIIGIYIVYANRHKNKRKVPKGILVTRGGDWTIVGNQSIFNYKIKIKNDSNSVISNMQATITSIPPGLEIESERVFNIPNLNKGAFISPTFKFKATESCVGNKIESIFTYRDYEGNMRTLQVKPFEIVYVCNLLVPKSVSEREYEKKSVLMKEKEVVFNCSLSPGELEQELTNLLRKNNFFLLDEGIGKKNASFRKLRGYAEGKYDKQEVALAVMMSKIAEGTTRLVIKAMSEREEKLIDLLRDLSTKCEPYKSHVDEIEVKCTNCSKVFFISESLKQKKTIICEICGEEIKV